MNLPQTQYATNYDKLTRQGRFSYGAASVFLTTAASLLILAVPETVTREAILESRAGILEKPASVVEWENARKELAIEGSNLVSFVRSPSYESEELRKSLRAEKIGRIETSAERIGIIEGDLKALRKSSDYLAYRERELDHDKDLGFLVPKYSLIAALGSAVAAIGFNLRGRKIGRLRDSLARA
jgi:hypothetical protein|tara:strand:- start:15702 stop:16253 length:552 start_codon:yes stop_codon:yes gene_type:complete